MPSVSWSRFAWALPGLTLGRRVEDPMGDTGRSPAFYRLADVPHFKVGQIDLPVSPGDGEIAKLADGIEGSIVVAAVRIVAIGRRF